VGGYAAAVVLIWKGAVIVRAIRRRPQLTLARVAFLALTALLLLTLASGFLWSYSGPHYLGGFSLLTVHGFLAVALLLLLIWHTVAKRFILRAPRARDRRTLLRFGGITLAGLLLWRAARPAQAALNLPGARRRFTGSYETGSFSGRFPHVSWLFDNPAPLETGTWSLRVEGAVDRPLILTLADLQAPGQERHTALIDCTGGWYSIQSWQGVPLSQLLATAGVGAGAQSITVQSATGYARRFSLAESAGYLLATHVAGAPLDHGHGYPVRLVAPGKRGFEWVKWVTTIRVNRTRKYWQPPLPLQ
jgi:DMSO/TMAO reductase YedYZ molybdopterin-dependent catalytic subunit